MAVFVVGLPICWLFDHYGRLNQFLPTFCSVGVLAFVVAIKPKLRWHPWFWVTMTILAAAHAALILLVPWTSKWVPALAIAALGSGDLIVMLAIVALVEKAMNDPTATAAGPRSEGPAA